MRAFTVTEADGVLTCAVSEQTPTPKDENDIAVRVEFSGLNFKDAMVASLGSRVRRLPSLIGGVDASGVIEQSNDETLPVGTRVAVHGGDFGVARDGGFAEHLFAPSRFLSPLPDSISTKDAMVIGTAGIASMASVLALEERGLLAGARVLVTGATGGVGSQAVTYLAKKGYQPVASTGSSDRSAWLEDLGAAEVIGRDNISDKAERVLGSELWDGAIDCIGGATLSQILRCLKYGGAVAASGLVAGHEINSTVYPFITRNIALLGIDVVEATHATRQKTWTALGEIASQIDFAALTDRIIGLDDLPTALDDVKNGSTQGRIVVDVTA